MLDDTETSKLSKAGVGEVDLEPIQLLEQRIMLDATLEWTLDAAVDPLDALTTLSDSFSEYVSQFDGIFGDIKTAFDTAVDGAESLFALVDGAPDTGVGNLDGILERIRSAVESVQNLFSDEFTALLDAAGSVGATQAEDFAINMSTYLATNYTPTGTPPDFTNYFTEADIRDIFGPDAFLAGEMDTRLSAFVAAKGVGDLAQIEQLSRAAFNQEITGGFISSLLSVDLNDVIVGGDTLIGFTQGGSNAEVQVQVNLPTVDTILDALALDPDLRMALPEAFSFVTPAESFGFDVNAIATAPAGGGVAGNFGILFDNFAADPLFLLDGSTTFANPSEVRLGMLQGQLDAIDTAEIGLFFADLSGAQFGVTVDIGTLALTTTDPAANAFDMELRIKEIGAPAFVAVTAGTSYDLIEFDISGTLSLSSVDPADTLAFGLDVILSSAIKTTGAGPTLSELLDSAGITTNVTLPGITDPVQQALAEDMVNALFNTGPEQIGAFLTNLGVGIADFLRSDFLSIGIPMTGFNMADGFRDIANFFGSLPYKFQFAADHLGFDANIDTYELIPDIPGQDSVSLTIPQLDFLAGIGSISLEVFTPAANPQDPPAQSTLDIDFSGLTPYLPSGDLDPNFLSQFATVFNTALNGINWSVSTNGGKLSFQSSNGGTASGSIFRIASALDTGGVALPDFGFADLGFGGDKIRLLDIPSIGSFPVLNVSAGIPSFDLGTFDLAALDGLTSFRLNITTDSGTQQVDVNSSNAGGWTSLTGLFADMNATFSALSIDITAGLNAAGDGIGLSLNAGATGGVSLGVDLGSLTRALDLNSLMDWINAEIGSLIPGAALTLADNGDLVFSLPDVTGEFTVGTGQAVAFNASDLGLGDLAGLNLGANLSGSISGGVSVAVGVNIVDVVSDFLNTTDPNVTRTSAFLDNTFITDLRMYAELEAEASSITGGADLGLAQITIGGTDPSSNFVKLDGQFDATIVGENAGTFSDRITLTQLLDIGQNFVGGTLGSGTDVTDMLGRMDLVGGILTDTSGVALNSGGSKAANVGELQIIADAANYTLGTDEALSFLYVSLGDVALDVGAVGLGAGIQIDAIDFSIGNIFDILEEFAVNIEAPGLDGLFDLQTGDIFDALAGIGDLLVSVGEMFADQFGFFDVEIPLMNFSLLDALDFSSDFLDALRDLRLDPDFGLTTIKGFLENIFGLNTVTLDWDANLNILNFDLNLDFLTDWEATLPFNFDLANLLGAQLDGLIGPDLAQFLTGFVDASGDGELIFDPDLFFNFSFGIDLSTMNLQLNNIAGLNTQLGDLATVFGVTLNGPGQDDLRIKWTDVTTGSSRMVNVDLDGASTLQDAIDLINAQLAADIGANVTASYNLTTGELTIADSNADLTDDTGVLALFGAASVDADTSVDPFGAIDLLAGFSDFTSAVTFDVVIGDAAPITVALDADAARTTKADFVAALNLELSGLDVSRSAISPTALPGSTIALSQLLRFSDGGAQIELHGTNFAAVNGYDPVAFSVLGEDVSHDVEFQLEELGQANAARLLGFQPDIVFNGAAVSKPIYDSPTLGRPVVYMDTNATEIRGEITVGAPGGLNLTLSLGPLEASVVDGSAYIGASTGNGDPGYISLTVNDIDGTTDGKYDLSHLADIGDDPALSYLDLFSLDADIAVVIDLPFSGGAGLLNPLTDGLTYESWLLKTPTPGDLSGFDINNPGGFFDGDLVQLFLDGSLDLDTPPSYRNFSLDLPDFTDFFANFNVLDFLNDPRAVLGGLDMIMKTIQGLYDDYLADINLPLIGDSLATGISFFDTFRYDFIEPALAFAETPDANGNLPTTVDIINGFLNDLLNDFLGTTGQQLIQADLFTATTLSDSYLYGAISFNGELFREKLDIDFDFGVPGLDIGVDQGSAIELVADYTINLGFGIDKNGFFLLNDTDEQEISIDLLVDANDFTGSMNVLGVLGLEATVDPANGGVAEVTASLGADLFGTAGTDLGRDYSGITLYGGATFENTVYVPQIDQSQLISFNFVASADVNIGLRAMITDPTTGNELLIGGVAIIPNVTTEFVFSGSFDASVDSTFQLSSLGFMNVSVDATTLYETLLKPIIDPIEPILGPLTTLFDWLNTPPMLYAKQALTAAFPIFGLVDTIAQLVDYMDQLATNNGIINFGDFDFSGSMGGVSNGSASLTSLSSGDAQRDASGATVIDGTFSGTGLEIGIPLLTDPFMALNLLLGKFDQVDLVTAKFTLFDADFSIDPVQQIVSAIGAPGWVSGAISSVFRAGIDLELRAGFEVGYDLSGIVNFMNTYDPVRLLDGVFINSEPGSLIYVNVNGYFDLNLGIAGLSSSLGGYFSLNFNDPNADGKLRIPELIALVEAGVGSGDPIDFLGYIFEGEAGFHAYLSVWFGINLPWPLPDLKWSTTVFNIDVSTSFGGFAIPPKISTDLAGGTQILNIGAGAGGNMSTISTDGDDTVVITGNSVAFSSDGQSLLPASLTGSGSVIIPAGNGDNVIDLTSLSSAYSPTITYTGTGTDTVRLPSSGLHVVFAGEGNDTITANGSPGATYVVFAEGGADTVNITGGNTVVISGDDFGMRDLFLTEFAQGNVTEARVLELLGINRDGTVNAARPAYYDTGNGKVNLAGLMSGFTSGTQLNAQGDDEIISVGAGNQIILTGNGDDLITVAGNAASGNVTVMSGGGDDQITATAGTVFVEGGAGEDLMVFGNGNNTAYGWGAEGETADLGYLMRMDGDDIIVGAAGNDVFYGQYGKDIISGGFGDDIVDGGRDNDVLSGGVLKVVNAATSAVIDLTVPGALELLQTNIVVETEDFADGTDTVRGQGGLDVLFGGGGDDTLAGGISADILIGDFGKIGISGNRIAQTFISTGFNSTSAGSDNLDGGKGDDILVAGGSTSVAPEVITDLEGNNTIFGDFGEVVGTRILKEITAYRTISSSFGTVDIITTGDGNDVIFGGEQSDVINAGMGADIVFGDLGEYAVASGELTTTASSLDGDDQIIVGNVSLTGDKMDIVLGGGGSDGVTSGDGGLVLLADYGAMKLNPIAVNALMGLEPLAPGASQDDIDFYNGQLALIARLFENMESVTDTNAGDDALTSVDGITYAIMGGGSDTATLAGSGLSYLLGDDGKIDFTRANSTDPASITMESVANSNAGDDVISTGSARDVVIGGDGADTLDTGAGTGILMGDNGIVILTDEETALPVSMTTTQSAGDGIDTVTGGTGIDFAILGGAGDTANLGDGRNYVLGDDGSILLSGATPTVTLETMASTNGGADTITTGANRDVVLGGDAGDTIASGAGLGILMGDSGKVVVDEGETALPASMVTTQSAGDGVDDVTAGAGIDFAILGGAGDTANLGDGRNYVLGDDGSILLSGATPTVTLETMASTNGGADTITTGANRDVILGGDAGDTIASGEGLGILMGDSGKVVVDEGETTRPASMVTTQSAGDGIDDVTAGAGIDFAILGGAGDTADMGDGVNYVLGDDGSIMVAGATPGMTLETMASTNGGADTITTGAGRDTAIGGDAGDTFVLGEGDNAVLGDSGRIVITEGDTNPTEMATTASAGDGDDNVTTGAGIDLAILGLGADTAQLGDGNNRAIGDSGIIRTSGVPGSEYLETIDPANGGDDNITTGAGHDIVLGGQGADTLTTNAGYDVVVGDNAIIQKNGAGGLHTLRAMTGDYGGDDVIDSGDGNDILVGGLGNDQMTVGNGEDVALGDLGDVDFRNITDVVNVTMTRLDAGGDDIITAAGTTGDNVLMGQAGADTITGGETDDWIIGDLAEITFTDPRNAYPGQSAMDRISFVNFINPDLGFDDVLNGGAGNDFLLGGFGADLLNGGDGQDFLLGDSIRFYRTIQPGSPLYEEIRLETTYAYVTGGYDVLTGGDGADVMVGNLGPDLFVGNTAADALFSDGFAGIFGATLPNGFGGVATDVHRQLITANFAGSGPLDIVSNAQYDQSIGVYLSTATVLEAIETDFAAMPFGSGEYEPLAAKSGQASFEELSVVTQFFSEETIMRHLAELILLDVDGELAKDDILRLFRIYMTDQGGAPSALQMTIFNKMLGKLLETLDDDGAGVYSSTMNAPEEPAQAAATN